MTKAKFAAYIFAALVALALLPSSASAQSTISGLVRDASGAVVADATVEAASEVLIERVRGVRTNGEGRYAIVDLRPGTYTVTVTAPGRAAKTSAARLGSTNTFTSRSRVPRGSSVQ